MEPIFSFNPLPPEEMRHYCWCCQALLTTKGECPICDMAGMMSPPHVCRRSGRVIGDEDGCEPEFEPLGPDHETAARHEDHP